MHYRQRGKTEFSVSGKTTRIENGMIIYSVNDDFEDSTIVENNTFEFKLPYSPIKPVLRTKDNFADRFLWLEEKPMTFNVLEEDFLRANIKGSKPEDLSKSLYSSADTLEREECRAR